MAEQNTNEMTFTTEQLGLIDLLLYWTCVDECKSVLILGLRLANERRRYKVTTSLIGWAQT